MPHLPTVPRLIAEGVVVIFSILIAFAIDAWWDRRGETRAREAILQAIQSDVDAAQNELLRVRNGMARGREGTEAFLSLADRELPGPEDAAAVDQIATLLFISPSFDAPLGSLQALLGGGDLSYLENPDLIKRVTRVLALIANLEREQQVLAENVYRIQEAMNSLAVDASRILPRLETTLWQFPSTAVETQLWQHVTDVRLRSLALTSWARYRLCLTSLEQIESEFLAITGLIDGQRGD